MFQTIAAKVPMRTLSRSLQGRRPCRGWDTPRLSELSCPAREPENTARGSQRWPPRRPEAWAEHGAPPETGTNGAAGPHPCGNSATQHCPAGSSTQGRGPLPPKGLWCLPPPRLPGVPSLPPPSPQPAAATGAGLVHPAPPALAHPVPNGAPPPPANPTPHRPWAVSSPQPQMLFSVHTLVI